MRCHEVRSWTFKGLVAAFVDLSVAFSLLCASSLVYLSSKFLGLFGLNLPCPCDGLFSDPHKNKCFQETLRNLPVNKISSVQISVRNTTPFDSILCKEANGECIGKKRKAARRRHVELEREVSSTPVEKVGSSGFDLLTSQSLKKGTFEINSKPLSFDNNFPQSSPANVLNDRDENDPLLLNSKDNVQGEKTSEDVSLRKSVSLSSGGCEAGGVQNKKPERTFSWAQSSPVDLTNSGITQKTMEILEQVIAEERAALALELEKERNAAATAADEALGMILRLQEEKASIEMEARQYQRMIEEKSAFDAEEMSILKEILLIREREKHVLEKEVDTYRQMFLEQQQMSEPLEIFTNQMDNALVDKSVIPGDAGEVDQNTERDQSRSEFHVHQEAVSRCSNISDSNKVEVNDHVKLDRSQSVSDTSYGLPLACLRRNSMSAVDYERMKIESEVGLLRGRLRALRKGREKLSFKSQVVKAISMTLDLHSA